LGGSDPFMICSDADIEKATTGAVKGRLINCSQSCITSKRFFVVKELAKAFIEKFVQKTEKLRIGNPMSEATDICSLVNLKSLENIDNLINDAVSKATELIIGGEKVGKDFFINQQY
jgi:succinate-semialdehyde dehydrogenase/glutarate-semialdehyde dehydrogenase/succinyl-CoA reductase